MNSKQRFLTALSNGQPDRVPVFDWIDEPVRVELARILGLASGSRPGETALCAGESLEGPDLTCLLVRELGLDATILDYSKGLERIGDGYARDKYGCIYRLSEHGEPVVSEGPITEPSDIRGYDMVSKLEPDDFAEAKYIIDRLGAGWAHVMGLADPFKISWLLRGGMQHLLVDFIRNPELVHDLARIATDFNMAAIDMAREMGVDAIIMYGDLAGERTTLISLKHYREYIKPYHRETVDYAHREGLRIVKHTDGNAWLILDDFVEAGFDGFHPIQPQCMDIAEVKEHLAGSMSLLGNIDCRDLLPYGTEEEVEQVVKETIRVAAPGGGYIICSSNSIHPGCKAENFVAMVEAAHKYGVYD